MLELIRNLDEDVVRPVIRAEEVSASVRLLVRLRPLGTGCLLYTSWLVEAEPQVFAELDPELAKERGIGNGDVVRVSSARRCV